MKYKKNSSYDAPVVILVRPQMAENIGMVARAMMNCGLSELRLVQPRENHLSDQAISSASGAQIILEEAKVFTKIEEAVSDIHYLLATTSRKRGISKAVYTPEEAMPKLFQKNQKIGLLFGPERTGLENKDLMLVDALLTIPLNPIHPSLNLSQAVLLTGWIWWQEKLKKLPSSIKKETLASKEELNCFLSFLQKKLEQVDYFQWPTKKERMLQNIQNIFTKSNLKSREIKTLYRIINKISQ